MKSNIHLASVQNAEFVKLAKAVAYLIETEKCTTCGNKWSQFCSNGYHHVEHHYGWAKRLAEDISKGTD